VSLEFSARKRLGRFQYDASFAVSDEFVVLFGHSGAGKSVTLAMIAGLMRPDEGRIVIDGRLVFDSSAGVDLQPQMRNTGYVVQDLALFPHMSVADNIAFGMPAGVPRGERVTELLQLFRLDGFEKRRPRTLSGGQQQRVALARALAREARVLLLDEPFSALDESLRIDLRRELLHLKERLGLTIVFVTHDLREAHLLADRLAVFDDGELLQFGTRDDVFRRPAHRRVAELTGVSNIFRGSIVSAQRGEAIVDAAGLSLKCNGGAASQFKPAELADVAIRAERVNLRRAVSTDAQASNFVDAVIVAEDAYGSSHTLRFATIEGSPLVIEVEIAARPYEVLGVANEKRWTLELPPEDLHVMPVVDRITAPDGHSAGLRRSATTT
jgi:molybdate transport system ATP-binding protein